MGERGDTLASVGTPVSGTGLEVHIVYSPLEVLEQRWWPEARFALLVALADGAPADNAVQRRAQLEYQRLRALFDQSSSFDHALLRELRPVVDAAQNRGIDVSITAERTLPAISDTEIGRAHV